MLSRSFLVMLLTLAGCSGDNLPPGLSEKLVPYGVAALGVYCEIEPDRNMAKIQRSATTPCPKPTAVEDLHIQLWNFVEDPSHYVIAFRGTDDGQDWWSGNMLPMVKSIGRRLIVQDIDEDVAPNKSRLHERIQETIAALEELGSKRLISPDRAQRAINELRSQEFLADVEKLRSLVHSQYTRSQQQVDNLLSGLPAGSSVSFTGHSLGGGLAEASFYRLCEGSDHNFVGAFVFNASPVTNAGTFRRCAESKNGLVYRVEDSLDPLRALRLIKEWLTQLPWMKLKDPNLLTCSFSAGLDDGPFAFHSMDRLLANLIQSPEACEFEAAQT